MFASKFARIVLILAISSPSIVLSKECTPEDARQANHSDARVPGRDWSWKRLYESFVRFGHCSDSKNPGIWDAELSTAYDGAVQHLLVDDWKSVSQLGQLVRIHPEFGDFVIAHINETFPLDGAKALVSNARNHCPDGYGNVCRAIEQAARPTPDSE
jgi:hypothetical protein